MADTMLTGRYDLVFLSPTGVELGKIASFHSNEVSGVTGTPVTDVTKMPKLPVSKAKIGQDFYFLLRFTPDATVSELAAGAMVSTVKVPFRAYDISTKTVYRNSFTTNAAGTAGYPSEYTFTSMRPNVAQDWTAGITYNVFQWKMPAGILMSLGVLPLHAGDYAASSVAIQRDVKTS